MHCVMSGGIPGWNAGVFSIFRRLGRVFSPGAKLELYALVSCQAVMLGLFH
jgi:hypothetical protein